MTRTSKSPLPRSSVKPRFFKAFGSDSSDKASGIPSGGRAALPLMTAYVHIA